MACSLSLMCRICQYSRPNQLARSRAADADIVPKIITCNVVGKIFSIVAIVEFVGDVVGTVSDLDGKGVGLLLGVVDGEVVGCLVGQGLVQKYALRLRSSSRFKSFHSSSGRIILNKRITK